MNQKRIKEDQFQDQDQDSNSDCENSKANIQKMFKCRCGKSYIIQSSLFNHIRIKHDNNKKDFAIPRGIPSGRPRKSDEDKNNPQTKNQKPKDVDSKTWDAIKIYKIPLFQNLIIGFKDQMKNNFVENKEVQDQNWSEYENKRQQLFKQLQFSARDVKEIIKSTDPILQAWGLLLVAEVQIDLYQIFISQYILKFYNLPNQKRDIIKNHIKNIENQLMVSSIIREILNQTYEIQQDGEEQQNEEQNQNDGQENKENFEKQTKSYDENQNEESQAYKSEDQRANQYQLHNQNTGVAGSDRQEVFFDSNEIIQQVQNYDHQQINDNQQTQSYLYCFSQNLQSYQMINKIAQNSVFFHREQSIQISQYLQNQGIEEIVNSDDSY
ncbi:hypothetical protein ABPG72_007134 [Tetrahymena utriculariae]